MDKFANIEILLIIGNIRVEWQKEIHKAISHFIIGKSKLVRLETRVVLFNRQIAALINQRNRIPAFCPVLVG